MLSHSVVSDSATPWIVTHQVPLSMKFSKQEYWSGLPCRPLGDLPNPGMEPRSPTLQVDYLPAEPQGKPKVTLQFSSVAQSCPALSDPMGCSPPGILHEILQARILEWVSTPSSRGSSWPRDRTCASCGSCIARQILYHWATWEAQYNYYMPLLKENPLLNSGS